MTVIICHCVGDLCLYASGDPFIKLCYQDRCSAKCKDTIWRLAAVKGKPPTMYSSQGSRVLFTFCFPCGLVPVNPQTSRFYVAIIHIFPPSWNLQLGQRFVLAINIGYLLPNFYNIYWLKPRDTHQHSAHACNIPDNPSSIWWYRVDSGLAPSRQWETALTL